jgi:hypothetical protein
LVLAAQILGTLLGRTVVILFLVPLHLPEEVVVVGAEIPV